VRLHPLNSVQMRGGHLVLLLAALQFASSGDIANAASGATASASEGGGGVAALRELRSSWPIGLPPSLNSSCGGLPSGSSCAVRLSQDGQRVTMSVVLPAHVRGVTIVVPKPPTEASQGTEVYCGGGLVWDGVKLIGGVFCAGIMGAVARPAGVAFNVSRGTFVFESANFG
jgi:hypothetical protein